MPELISSSFWGRWRGRRVLVVLLLAPVLVCASHAPSRHANLAYAPQLLHLLGGLADSARRRSWRRAPTLRAPTRGLTHGRLRLCLFPEQGDEDVSPHAQAFYQWRLDSGVESVVTLAHFGDLRGMMATEPICKGDALLSYPRSVTMDLASLDDCPCAEYVDADFWKNATWFVQLALWVLAEERKGAASEWAPYISMLPRDMAVPRDWSDAELSLLEYAPLVTDVKKQQKEFATVFDQVLPHLVAEPPSLHSMSWAMSIALSRAFQSTPPRESPSATEVPGEAPGWRENKALVPMLDHFNHRSAAHPRYSYDPDSDVFSLVSESEYEEGEQVVRHTRTHARTHIHTLSRLQPRVGERVQGGCVWGGRRGSGC